MKLLIFSDSHGVVSWMKRAVQSEQPDRILHLGDVVRDAQTLARMFPEIPLEFVCGNCDWNASGIERERIVEAEDIRILMMHGHTRGVKTGIERAVLAAREADADVLLFGHTHQPLCEKSGPLWILNPGTIQGIFCITYGVITIEQGRLECHTVRMDCGEKGRN